MLIGTNITDWSAVDGTYYAGVGSEGIWLAISAILCIGALIVGARHEKAAYKKAK